MKTLMLVSVELCGEGLEIYQTNVRVFTGVDPFVLYELKLGDKCLETKSTTSRWVDKAFSEKQLTHHKLFH